LLVHHWYKAYGNFHRLYYHAACARPKVEELLLQLQDVLAAIDDLAGALPRLAVSKVDEIRNFATEELGRLPCSTGSSQS
jgi:hypothetical protein